METAIWGLVAAVILLALTVGRRLKSDWYVVEWRTWTNDGISNDAYSVPEFGFDKLYMEVHSLTLESQRAFSATMVSKNGGQINIQQTVFEDLNAARIYFKRSVSYFPSSPTYGKLYLWRTVAQTREKAVVLPPHRYYTRSAELLLQHPRVSYAKPNPNV